MKKIILSTVFVLLSSNAHSQGWIFSRSTDAQFIEPFSSIATNEGIYVHGSFGFSMTSPATYTSYGSRDLILTKYDLNGQFQWSRRTGSDSVEIPKSIVADANNNIYVIASFSRTCNFESGFSLTSTGGLDFFLAKYNSEGTLLWAKNVGRGSGAQTPADLIIDEDNNIVITGYFKNKLIIGDPLTVSDTLIGNSFFSPFISKFSNEGELIWAKNILVNNNNTYFRKITVADNGYYLSGTFQGTFTLDIGTISSFSNTEDLLLFKIDKDGNGIWVRKVYGNRKETLRSLKTDEFQNAYILGSYTSDNLTVDSTSSNTTTFPGNEGGSDSFIAKYNRNGVLQWFIKKGSSSNDGYNDIAIRNNLICATGFFTNLLVIGNDTLHTSGIGNSDAFFVVFNEIGDPINAVSIVGTGNYADEGDNVLIDSKSQSVVIGNYRSPSIVIGNNTYSNPSLYTNEFFAIYQQPFRAIITDENMVSCNGANDGMLKVTGYFGRPPYTYQWSHNASLNNPVATGLAPGTYTVTIRDADNKTASVTRDVTQPASITIDGIVSQVSCYNGGNGVIGITVTGGTSSGTYTYRWSTLDGSGIIPVNEDQNNLSSGTYNVEVTDDNLCTATKNFIVAEPAAFDYTGSFATPITSPGNGAVTINITGGNTPYKSFRWNGPSGYLNNTEDITGLGTSGLYYFTLTDANDCVSDTSFAVLDNITFIAQITSKTDITCKDDDNGTASVTVHNATGTVTYAWTGFAPTTNNTINNMPPGKYTMVATDQGGHTATDTITIFEPKDLFLYPLEKLDPLCNGDNKGVVNLTLTGGTLPYSYNWNNGYYTGEDLVNVPGGTYTVVVTDANGCVKSTNTTVVEPALIGLFITQEEEILCNGGNSAVALAHGSGGTPAGTFTYLWDDPGAQITPAANELEAGNYSVTITDNNGCSRSASITIDEPDLLAITSQIVSPSCPGDEDGSIVPTPTGGTGTGYEYIWSNNVYQRFNTDLEAGQYILTLNDANNCILIDTFDLADPDTVKIASVIPSSPTCEGLEDGSINITATGGNGIYEYSVDGGITYNDAANLTSLSQGDYVVRVRDGNECVSETTPVSLTLSDACGLIIYDAFSPDNGDDLNDVWTIENAENFPGIKVNIFNIWGIEVFSSTGYEEPWDGTYNGKELPSGTYYYVIDPGDGSKTRSGSVNIVK